MPRRRHQLRAVAAVSIVALVAALASGCTPTCRETCRKVLKCDLSSERISVDECTDSCLAQDDMFEGWEDEKEKRELHEEHKRCLMRSTCDQIEAGECYDDELFAF